jgi:uncharacterized protein YdiU (UPF0061 family)
MQEQLARMWAAKLGIDTFDADLFSELATLMMQTPVDYTLFFRELSSVPDDIAPLKKSFYTGRTYAADPEGMDERWSAWLSKWRSFTRPGSREALSSQMKRVNPKYSLREWFVVPAYQQATEGKYTLLRELQDVMTQPYAEQSKGVEGQYYRLKPPELFEIGGSSHLSCSS